MIIVKMGVSEFNMPAVLLGTLVCAIAKQKEGMPVVAKPTNKNLGQFAQFMVLNLKNTNGMDARHAMPIRKLATCIGVRPVKHFLMSINELPQISPRTIS